MAITSFLVVANDRSAGAGQKIRLRRFGKKRPWLAHRVSLEWAEGAPPEGKNCAIHSCDNPSCVRPDHLRWGDMRDNTDDKIARGRLLKGPDHSARMLKHAAKGEAQGHAKLTDSAVSKIRSDPRFNHIIAKEYGVSRITIGEVKRRVTWAHVD